ncbi:aminotransferase class I/II-fold pyridoxal phosphate-dependent enzyme [Alicyclobacillus sp. SO9]|uniref:aminotransferase class I/II-fold pyridoxal phosphate-dependent enzyme n=1 Tax=Alicyclobacillus sp. SO9 TaxID=2665646 RepID=UPI001E5B342B|nr:aminotransferase class I/II-fold pyridoxal phosphate-dependent enzyme [Alicyclobacillus sp. SO9]
MERRTGVRVNVRLGANESAYGVSPKAAYAMREAVEDVMWYGDPESYELRQQLNRQLGFPMDSMLVAGGIDELLGLIVRVFLEPGQAVVASDGAYPTFLYHVDGFGGYKALVPYHNYRNDLEALAQAARDLRAKMVYLANPDNPTGTHYSASDLHQFLHSLPSDCLFLLDEAYIEFASEDIHLQSDYNDERLIRFRTFSKLYGMAGARIGYVIAHPDVIQTMHKVRLHFGVNRMAQAGALAALTDNTFTSYVLQDTARGKQEYYQLAEELGYTPIESSTNFVAIDVGSTERAQALVQQLFEKGIFIRSPGTDPLSRCIRVTVGTSEQRQVVGAALKSLSM